MSSYSRSHAVVISLWMSIVFYECLCVCGWLWICIGVMGVHRCTWVLWESMGVFSEIFENFRTKFWNLSDELS